MNHLIEKPWELPEDNHANQHIGEQHSLGFKVALIHAVVKGNSGAHRLFTTLEDRGLDALLLIVPCLVALLFL